jgi:hypothetical protein
MSVPSTPPSLYKILMATTNSPQSFMTCSSLFLLLSDLLAIHDFAQLHGMIIYANRLQQRRGHSGGAAQKLLASLRVEDLDSSTKASRRQRRHACGLSN